MRRLAAVIIFALFGLGVSTTFAQLADPQATPSVILVGGLVRTYRLYVPPNLTAPAPVLFVLHARTSTSESMERFSRFNPIADAQGFIVVYPDGLANEWNYIKDIPGYQTVQDDSAFLVAIADELAARLPVDLTRLYVVGFSNGGFMAQRAACDQPSRFAAFATVAAGGFGGMPLVCPQAGTATAPILMIHGTSDSNVLWDGYSVTEGDQTVFVTYAIPDTLGFWAEYNGCSATANVSDIPQLGNSVGTNIRLLDVDCPEGTDVKLYAVVNGGHNWPGQPVGIPAEIGGLVNLDIDASQTIWGFVSQFRRAAP
ncbi:MAG: alpha/beta hydrolase family esterase [Phototrophicaceae bacterium]